MSKYQHINGIQKVKLKTKTKYMCASKRVKLVMEYV